MTTAVLFEMQAFKGVTPLGASWQTAETLCDAIFSWYQIVIAVVELRAAQYWDFRIENGFSFTKLSHKVIVKVIN